MNKRIDINSIMNKFKLVTIDAFEPGVVEVPIDCVTVDCVTVDCITVVVTRSNALISPYSPYN